MEEKIIDAVASTGVPAIICIYLIIQVDRTMAALTRAIDRVDAKLDAYLTAHGMSAARPPNNN